MIDRLRSIFRDHGEATAMLGGAVGVLVVIVIGIVLLQGAMIPTGRRAAGAMTTTPSPDSSVAVVYASPSTSPGWWSVAAAPVRVPLPTSSPAPTR